MLRQAATTLFVGMVHYEAVKVGGAMIRLLKAWDKGAMAERMKWL